MNKKIYGEAASQETGLADANERILGRKLAIELTQDELSTVFGGHIPPVGETCSGMDCDQA